MAATHGTGWVVDRNPRLYTELSARQVMCIGCRRDDWGAPILQVDIRCCNPAVSFWEWREQAGGNNDIHAEWYAETGCAHWLDAIWLDVRLAYTDASRMAVRMPMAVCRTLLSYDDWECRWPFIEAVTYPGTLVGSIEISDEYDLRDLLAASEWHEPPCVASPLARRRQRIYRR